MTKLLFEKELLSDACDRILLVTLDLLLCSFVVLIVLPLFILFVDVLIRMVSHVCFCETIPDIALVGLKFVFILGFCWLLL